MTALDPLAWTFTRTEKANFNRRVVQRLLPSIENNSVQNNVLKMIHLVAGLTQTSTSEWRREGQGSLWIIFLLSVRPDFLVCLFVHSFLLPPGLSLFFDEINVYTRTENEELADPRFTDDRCRVHNSWHSTTTTTNTRVSHESADLWLVGVLNEWLLCREKRKHWLPVCVFLFPQWHPWMLFTRSGNSLWSILSIF